MDRGVWKVTVHGLQSQHNGVGGRGILLLGWLEKKTLLCCKHQSLSSLAPCT